jgi:hypothetical protein
MMSADARARQSEQCTFPTGAQKQVQHLVRAQIGAHPSSASAVDVNTAAPCSATTGRCRQGMFSCDKNGIR